MNSKLLKDALKLLIIGLLTMFSTSYITYHYVMSNKTFIKLNYVRPEAYKDYNK